MARPDRERGRFFSAHDLAALVGIAGALAWIHHWQPRLPALVPTHWNAAGRVDAWTPRGQLSWLPILIAGGVWLFLVAVGLMLRPANTRQRLSAKALRDFRGWLACGLALMTGYLGPMGAIQGTRALGVGLLLLFGCMAIGFVPLVRAVKAAPPIAGASERDYRLGGLLYWNPQDHHLWVRKRLGMGWTLNFGRPAAWLVMGLLLLPVLAAVVLWVTTSLSGAGGVR